MVSIQSYPHFGGSHPETAALKNILQAQGVRNPHNGEPYSEAMLLGIGGGLGAGYILWEFKQYDVKVLVFGWQNRWQYPIKFYENLCERINVTPTLRETGSSKAAVQQLDEALKLGRPVIAWVDQAQMPHWQLPQTMEGHFGHFIAIYGVEDGMVLVDDLAAKPFRVPVDTMVSARGRIGSYKNRLLMVTANGEADLVAAIRDGIQDEIAHLSQDSDSFSLPTFQKWGKMMTNRKNAKGWPVVFADRRGLYSALKSVYEGVELVGTGGGGMRGLYADFLDEAAGIVKPSLKEVAKTYRDLAAQWTALADAVLPDNVEPLRETKALLRERYDILMREGGEGVDKMRPLTTRLGNLYDMCKQQFPMSEAEIDRLFESLGERLLDLYKAEVAALTALTDAMN